jgi:hypothetical protein
MGGTKIRSIGHLARVKRLADNDAPYVELMDDNRLVLAEMR